MLFRGWQRKAIAARPRPAHCQLRSELRFLPLVQNTWVASTYYARMVVRRSQNPYVLHSPCGLRQWTVRGDYGEERNGFCEKNNVVGDPMTSGDGRRYLCDGQKVNSRYCVVTTSLWLSIKLSMDVNSLSASQFVSRQVRI